MYTYYLYLLKKETRCRRSKKGHTHTYTRIRFTHSQYYQKVERLEYKNEWRKWEPLETKKKVERKRIKLRRIYLSLSFFYCRFFFFFLFFHRLFSFVVDVHTVPLSRSCFEFLGFAAHITFISVQKPHHNCYLLFS